VNECKALVTGKECRASFDHGNNIIDNDIIQVNGVPWPKMSVMPRLHRFRCLIANINRSYRLMAGVLPLKHVLLICRYHINSVMTGGRFATLASPIVASRTVHYNPSFRE
jgi:hypothetical protein